MGDAGCNLLCYLRQPQRKRNFIRSELLINICGFVRYSKKSSLIM